MALDGPFPVFTHDADGELTDVHAEGVHYMADFRAMADRPELEEYVVTPTHALQRVWAGDDPEEPMWTVSLRFPDQATADSVLG